MVFSDGNIKGEVLKTISLHGRLELKRYFKALMTAFWKRKFLSINLCQPTQKALLA
jgi:hypothetical protein